LLFVPPAIAVAAVVFTTATATVITIVTAAVAFTIAATAVLLPLRWHLWCAALSSYRRAGWLLPFASPLLLEPCRASLFWLIVVYAAHCHDGAADNNANRCHHPPSAQAAATNATTIASADAATAYKAARRHRHAVFVYIVITVVFVIIVVVVIGLVVFVDNVVLGVVVVSVVAIVMVIFVVIACHRPLRRHCYCSFRPHPCTLPQAPPQPPLPLPYSLP
jgi:hypothetical protein